MSTEVSKFNPLVGKLTKAIEPMLSILVLDKDSKDKAYQALMVLKGYEKAIDEVRDGLVRPHNELVKEINSKAKEVLVPLEKVKRKISDSLVDYDAKVRKAQQLEDARLAAEKKQNEQETRAKLMNLAEEAAELDPTTAAMKHAEIVAQAQAKQNDIADQKAELKTETVKGLRSNWLFSITDAKAVKPEFMIPDEKAIGKVVRSLGPKAASLVGGIEIWDDPSIASGSTPPKGRALK